MPKILKMGSPIWPIFFGRTDTAEELSRTLSFQRSNKILVPQVNMTSALFSLGVLSEHNLAQPKNLSYIRSDSTVLISIFILTLKNYFA